MKTELKREIHYENVELIKPARREELIRDLEERTGLKIHRVDVERIDYLRDAARIYIYFYEEDWRNTDSGIQANNNDD